MKCLIFLSVLLLVCGCNAKPGISYFLESLTEDYKPIFDKFNAVKDVIFWLYTNQGPKDGVPIHFNDFNATTLARTTFNKSNPTRILIHGFLNNINSTSMFEVRDAYLKRGNINVIFIDWGAGASTIDYVAARNRIPSVGTLCANVSNFLLGNGYANLGSLVIVGHSLGGQTTGLCAKQIKGKLRNIVGLDPAGPLFSLENKTARIDKDDAENVEIIHTDGDVWGFAKPLGTKDVYPNYGMAAQPGCEWDPSTTLSHRSSIHYFSESIAANNTFIADQCTSYQVLKCTVNSTGYKMGGEPLETGVKGIFYLKTNGASPYGRNGQNAKTGWF